MGCWRVVLFGGVGVEVDVVAEAGFGDVEAVDLAGGEEDVGADDGVDGGDGGGSGGAGAGDLGFDVAEGEAGVAYFASPQETDDATNVEVRPIAGVLRADTIFTVGAADALLTVRSTAAPGDGFGEIPFPGVRVGSRWRCRWRGVVGLMARSGRTACA